MARTEEDLVEVCLDLAARVSLDMERVEEDPVYHQCLLMADENVGVALQMYLEHYIIRERFLRDVPSTNGPGRLAITEWVGLPNASSNSTENPRD